MPSYLGVPACGLAAFAAVRARAHPVDRGVGVALIVGAFAPLPGAGLLGGALLAARAARPRLRPSAPQVVIGVDQHRRPVAITLGDERGSHALIVGATGSGKTVTEALIVARAIERGTRRGDRGPQGRPAAARRRPERAERAGREYGEWTPRRPELLQPLRARQRGRDRRQGARRGALQRAALPAPGAALPRARRPGARGARRDADAGAGWLELMDPRASSSSARAMPDEEHAREDLRLSRLARRAAASGARGDARPPRDPRRVGARAPARARGRRAGARPAGGGPRARGHLLPP